jgi:hypothetical protein
MTSHVIWAFVASLWALVLWDMVRRWAFATATRTLAADLDEQRRLLAAMGGEIAELRSRIDERGIDKLPARVKQLEQAYGVLKGHVETRLNPFAAKKTGT